MLRINVSSYNSAAHSVSRTSAADPKKGEVRGAGVVAQRGREREREREGEGEGERERERE